jgi:hypothetical protein
MYEVLNEIFKRIDERALVMSDEKIRKLVQEGIAEIGKQRMHRCECKICKALRDAGIDV